MDPNTTTLEVSNSNKDLSVCTIKTRNTSLDVIESISQRDDFSNASHALETCLEADEDIKYSKKDKEVFEQNKYQFEDQREYCVEVKLSTRKSKGTKKYKIRWCGFSLECDTWEPQKYLSQNLLKAYENKKKNENKYRTTGASKSVRLDSLTLSKPIFQLNGQFNQVLDSHLNYYETNKWFIPGSGFERDDKAGLLACEVEMRFWAQLCIEWEKLRSTIEICPFLMGENWTSLKEKRETIKKMRNYSKYGFKTRSTIKVKFTALLQTGKPVLGLVFASNLRNGDWYFLRVLSVLVVGKETSKRKVFLYNPLVREEAMKNGLMNQRVRKLKSDISASSPIQLGFGGQVDTNDSYIRSLRFISNIGDNYDYLNEIEWSDYNPY